MVSSSASSLARAVALLAGTQLALPPVGAATLVQRPGVVEADTWVDQASPDANAGADRVLRAVDTPGSQAQTFLRVSLGGATGGPVVAARLRLQVDVNGHAGSDSGGNLHAAGCGWNEETLTWNTRPAVDPLGLASVGAVQRRQVVAFDFTAALEPGRDVYCFALSSESPTFDDVIYSSREGKSGPPAVEVLVDEAPTSTSTTTPPPVTTTSTQPPVTTTTTSTSVTTTTVCGNGVAEPPLESCDGADDAACPGRCQGNCRCPGADDTFACLASGAGIVVGGTLADSYYSRALGPGTVIDARDATFVHCSQPDPSNPCATNVYPVNLGPISAPGDCWAGGRIIGANRLDATWSEMHSPNNAGFMFENGSFTVDGIRVDDVGDGIRPRGGAGGFLIKDVWLSYIRDDCVENDHLNGGVVDDSLFDGCFSAFSARNLDTTIDGHTNLWTIQNTLVRLQPMPGPPEGGDLGHKGFFKWIDWGDPNSRSPMLALFNDVFMAEEQGQFSADRMGIPPGKLAACANNVMVWLGPGDYPAVLPDCFTVTKDRSVWDSAVAEWIRRHPELGP